MINLILRICSSLFHLARTMCQVLEVKVFNDVPKLEGVASKGDDVVSDFEGVDIKVDDMVSYFAGVVGKGPDS
ncbi:hypothetical protein VNO77_14985 [Canavalia gladiata]|uniref:Uncharacterized protein n=1 Tax=Canavalia gladiata TaxID=3824 RepID=A0AAN9QS66_CANGL